MSICNDFSRDMDIEYERKDADFDMDVKNNNVNSNNWSMWQDVWKYVQIKGRLFCLHVFFIAIIIGLMGGYNFYGSS